MRFVPQHILFMLLLLPAMVTATPKPSVAISQAKWAKGVLSVKGSVRHSIAASVDVYDSSGRLLGQSPVDSKHRFTLSRTDLDRPELLCSVQAKASDATATAKVKGKPKSCGKVPQCKILSPVGSLAVMVNSDVSFKAKATLKDRKAEPLKMEWDFGGGSMGESVSDATPPTYLRPTNVATTVQFVRDNSRYRVRFSAWDKQNRYCEDSMEVVVGNPPDALETFQNTLQSVKGLAQASAAAAPPPASALKATDGSLVVLPYQDWTMQTASDARTVPDVYVAYGPQVNNINASVYQKARQPQVAASDKIDLRYSAASNPADPAGADSINSTSQNWPVGTSLLQSTVQKSDYFETRIRTDGATLAPDYFSFSFAGFLTPRTPSAADEGYHSAEQNPPINPDHGSYMPGIAAPYAANDTQAFGQSTASTAQFAAKMLPVTDIDDSGRVNPYPLFRIEAGNTGSLAPAAATDLTVSAGRDLHCRECHAKGKIGANPNQPDRTGGHNHGGETDRPLSFFEADSDSLFDQEYAAIRNAANLHRYSGLQSHGHGSGVWKWIEYGDVSPDLDGNPIAQADGPQNCNKSTCHTTALSSTPYGLPLHTLEGDEEGRPLSTDMHRFHGKLQYNAARDDILRAGEDAAHPGRPLSADPVKDWDPVTGSTPNSLFPVKDAGGKILPMEQNCLRCHGGLREQCYRDRMYSAGVTCYQCHGDMLAVGNMFPKSTPGADGNTYRQPWMDEPECGSCHTGNGNRGQDGNGGFFSAGVMKTAFDETDRSATPRQPDRFNPDEARFAVPVVAMDIGDIDRSADGGLSFTTQTPLYRMAKDNHGQVACAACHGAAHAIWPNRNPSANDNVTALQLQGHTGPIAECGVCHSADAFANFEDLDEGLKVADPKTGVLGGPHNMHPVNDPNWWRSAAADNTPNTGSGKLNGGWHNDYAKLPGRAGEDQCAACHGNDHRGTRLSKTPVDREFVDAKGKKIMVKAGTVIGCDLCHTVATSCTGSPNSTDCGHASDRVAGTTNQPPIIRSAPLTVGAIGETYRYAMDAIDPEGGDLAHHLNHPVPTGLRIDEHTGVITMPLDLSAPILIHLKNGDQEPPVVVDFGVQLSDSRGAYAFQSVALAIDCPAGLTWDRASTTCVAVAITSRSPVAGLDAGATYRYPVTAKQRNGEPLVYRLSGAPQGMTIDAATGLIVWLAQADISGTVNFTVTADNGHGGSAQQPVALSVCAAPDRWDATAQQCLAPVNITSSPPILGITAGARFSYPVTATQVDKLPLKFSLADPPAGMTIGADSGQIEWIAQASASGSIAFAVIASDGQGGSARQEVSLMVCAAPESWSDASGGCVGPIVFTSVPPAGVDAGSTYSYPVAATHANGLVLGYHLADADGQARPAGMNIDSNSGRVSWLAEEQPDTGGYALFSVVATDSAGYSANQVASVLVCTAPTHWDESMGICRSPVHITSTPSQRGIDIGQTYTYSVTATDETADAGPITFGLIDAPASMKIDSATGLITWVSEGPAYSTDLYFMVSATDKLGQQEQQQVTLTLCAKPFHWSETTLACE